MGKQDGCQEPEGKEVQAWASVGQPAAEMTEDCGKAERPKRTKGLCALGHGTCLFHQGLGGELSFSGFQALLLQGLCSGLGLSASPNKARVFSPSDTCILPLPTCDHSLQLLALTSPWGGFVSNSPQWGPLMLKGLGALFLTCTS